MTQTRIPGQANAVRGQWLVPLATALPLVLLLVVDVVLAGLSFAAGDGCSQDGPCAGVDQSRWHFGIAWVIVMVAVVGLVATAKLRVRRWLQWTIAALAVGSALWPVVWIFALRQPYLVG